MFVADTAVVVGDVVLGDQASLWFGAVVRGDCFPIRIGARTNVQDGAVVHVTGGKAGTTIGDDVTIGHSALVHGCRVGDRCLIGMGSIVLDGAVIGDDSLVAAGSWSRPVRTSRRGASSWADRPVSTRAAGDEELAQIRESAANYIGYAGAFMTGCTRVG